eukprot:maker-scaffold2266_size17862-snap-gene-0.3 protein:Tk11627 transcript:maker-scaffold2266_size17862-snap-gene-0.3-mRNA-1 annotation:"alkaline ceramidase 3-like"
MEQVSRTQGSENQSSRICCDQVSEVIAEFWNTLSSAFILISPLCGMIHMRNQNLELRCFITLSVLVIVGIGSILFHATLRYSMQLMDEVPMIYGGSAICYFLFEAMFLILVCLCVLGGSKLLCGKSTFISPSSKKLFLIGVAMYFFAGCTWNGDNHLCGFLRNLRDNYLPQILSPLTQLHAWWHFFSGVGTYVMVISLMEYRMRFLGVPCQVQWKWFGPTLVQEVPSKDKNKYMRVEDANKLLTCEE